MRPVVRPQRVKRWLPSGGVGSRYGSGDARFRPACNGRTDRRPGGTSAGLQEAIVRGYLVAARR